MSSPERYFRASNAVGAFTGTGIGLAGARQTAEAHGGTLSFESTEGVGTVVTLRLPLTLAAERAAGPGSTERAAGRHLQGVLAGQRRRRRCR